MRITTSNFTGVHDSGFALYFLGRCCNDKPVTSEKSPSIFVMLGRGAAAAQAPHAPVLKAWESACLTSRLRHAHGKTSCSTGSGSGVASDPPGVVGLQYGYLPLALHLSRNECTHQQTWLLHEPEPSISLMPTTCTSGKTLAPFPTLPPSTCFRAHAAQAQARHPAAPHAAAASDICFRRPASGPNTSVHFACERVLRKMYSVRVCLIDAQLLPHTFVGT